MPGIGIVTNPNSRQNRRHPEGMKKLGYILGGRGHIAMTKDLSDVATVAERFKEARVDILGLNGGDGTNHVTLTTFIEVYKDEPLPLIAFLRGGTMNTIANSCGVMKGSPSKILLNLVEKYHRGLTLEVVERDIVCVEDGKRKHYGFIIGNGMIYNFLAEYYGTGRPSPTTAVTTFTHAIGSAMVKGALYRKLFAPIRCQVEVDGVIWEKKDYLTVGASTIDQIGLGFKPFYRADAKPHTFQITGVYCPVTAYIAQTNRIRAGLPLDDGLVDDALARRAVIRADGDVNYTIDGDLHKGTPVITLSVGPRLRIIQG